MASVPTHFHACRKCSVAFEHPDSMKGNAEAHKCPGCGELRFIRWTAWQLIEREMPVTHPWQDAPTDG